jgi:hypothetical protein
MSSALRCFLIGLGLAATFTPAPSQTLTSVTHFVPNLVGELERPLRYTPEGEDFVIVNGVEFFNRPLYGGNTAFRVDAGDRPEFSLYLPGRGGNVRLGFRTARGAKWLNEADRVVARYRPGSMIYEIEDAALGGGGRLEVTALATAAIEGLIVRVVAQGIDDAVELIWAYGGVTGQRGVRDGDIGTEQVPISEYFQLQPAYCRDNHFNVHDGGFLLRSRAANIRGSSWPAARWIVADAEQWGTVELLLSTAGVGTETPVILGRIHLKVTEPVELLWQREAGATAEELAVYREVSAPPTGEASAGVGEGSARVRPEEIPALFAATQNHFAQLRRQVRVETPDPFLNAAVAALNVAADAVWDEPQGVVMHGAIAWRSRLLGWRGPYAMDALGWTDRARRHLAYWATRQNLETIPAELPPPEEETNLARRRRALHSPGNLSNSHYDMNLVYIDALFRHLRWTGDLAFGREVWPVIQRHLAWEQRLFRRDFTTAQGEVLPLYEAYAAIWASDELQYHGGGVAYTTAYNYFHHREAARLARLLGEDPQLYEREAELIRRGLREHLWLEPEGVFAEYQDWLGRRLVHRSPGLWSIYHVIDSEVATSREASRMIHYLQQHQPRLPIVGPGIPAAEDFGVYASSSWMPYVWSVNNVVMGENVHTALAFWQAGRPEEAYRLTKSAVLAAMYLGSCPGNSGSMSYLDVYRREAQRDFADGTGVLSRALVEGLFGIRPDLLAGEVRVAPGLPAHWDRAAIHHPKLKYSFIRDARGDTYRFEPAWERPVPLRVQLPVRAERAEIRLNGRIIEGKRRTREGVADLLEVNVPAGGQSELVVRWSGAAPTVEPLPPAVVGREPLVEPVDWSNPEAATLFEPVVLTEAFNDRVTQIYRNEYRSPRSPFVSLAQPKQGIGGWAGHVNATAEIDDRGLRQRSAEQGGVLILPNGVPLATPGSSDDFNVLFVSQWENYPAEATVRVEGRARRLFLLMAGSTNWMQSRLDNGEVVVRYRDGSVSRLPLYNPTTWWPIERDYFVDDYQFRRAGEVPLRVDLATGRFRSYQPEEFKGRGGKVAGGAATVLPLTLDPGKELESLTVRALANEVVIGLMAATLER